MKEGHAEYDKDHWIYAFLVELETNNVLPLMTDALSSLLREKEKQTIGSSKTPTLPRIMSSDHISKLASESSTSSTPKQQSSQQSSQQGFSTPVKTPSNNNNNNNNTFQTPQQQQQDKQMTEATPSRSALILRSNYAQSIKTLLSEISQQKVSSPSLVSEGPISLHIPLHRWFASMIGEVLKHTPDISLRTLLGSLDLDEIRNLVEMPLSIQGTNFK